MYVLCDLHSSASIISVRLLEFRGHRFEYLSQLAEVSCNAELGSEGLSLAVSLPFLELHLGNTHSWLSSTCQLGAYYTVFHIGFNLHFPYYWWNNSPFMGPLT